MDHVQLPALRWLINYHSYLLKVNFKHSLSQEFKLSAKDVVSVRAYYLPYLSVLKLGLNVGQVVQQNEETKTWACLNSRCQSC